MSLVNDDDFMHNKHYEEMPVEPLDLMRAIFTPEEYIGFLKGNMIKYAMRAGHKEGCSASEDADKFNTYNRFLYEFLREDCQFMHDKVFKVKEFYLKGEGIEELNAIKDLFGIDEDAFYTFVNSELYVGGYKTSYSSAILDVPVKNNHIMSLKVYVKDLDVVKIVENKDKWFRVECLEYMLKEDTELTSCDILFLDCGEFPSDDYTQMSGAYTVGYAWIDSDGDMQYLLRNSDIKPKWCRFIKF